MSLFAGFGVSQWNVFDWSYSWQLFYQGLVNGIIVAGLAAGLVLVYRATRIINFAHAAIGVFAASVGGLLVDLYGWNFWVSMILVVVLGALVGGIIELTVVRRLFDRPRLILFVATLGVNQLLLFATLQLPETGVPDRYPTAFTNNWDVGPLRIRADQLSALVGTAVLLGVLFWLLPAHPLRCQGSWHRPTTRTPPGSAGSAPAGCRPRSGSAAGILSTLSIILFAPVTGQNSNTLFGAVSDALFLKALAAALLAYLVSFPRALVAGLAIGVADQLIVTNVDFSGASTNLVGVRRRADHTAAAQRQDLRRRVRGELLRDAPRETGPRTHPQAAVDRRNPQGCRGCDVRGGCPPAVGADHSVHHQPLQPGSDLHDRRHVCGGPHRLGGATLPGAVRLRRPGGVHHQRDSA